MMRGKERPRHRRMEVQVEAEGPQVGPTSDINYLQPFLLSEAIGYSKHHPTATKASNHLAAMYSTFSRAMTDPVVVNRSRLCRDRTPGPPRRESAAICCGRFTANVQKTPTACAALPNSTTPSRGWRRRYTTHNQPATSVLRSSLRRHWTKRLDKLYHGLTALAYGTVPSPNVRPNTTAPAVLSAWYLPTDRRRYQVTQEPTQHQTLPAPLWAGASWRSPISTTERVPKGATVPRGPPRLQGRDGLVNSTGLTWPESGEGPH